MNVKHPAVVAMGILAFPVFAHAQAQAQAASEQNSSLVNFIWGVFPFIILIAIFIPLMRRIQKPIMKRSQDHMTRQVQHMERVEQSLDRIIKLLEKKD